MISNNPKPLSETLRIMVTAIRALPSDSMKTHALFVYSRFLEDEYELQGRAFTILQRELDHE